MTGRNYPFSRFESTQQRDQSHLPYPVLHQMIRCFSTRHTTYIRVPRSFPSYRPSSSSERVPGAIKTPLPAPPPLLQNPVVPFTPAQMISNFSASSPLCQILCPAPVDFVSSNLTSSNTSHACPGCVVHASTNEFRPSHLDLRYDVLPALPTFHRRLVVASALTRRARGYEVI